MKKFLSIFILFLILHSNVFAQGKSPYVIYSAKGKKVSYKKMLKQMTNNDIVFFGEMHNSAIAHWLQLELTIDFDKNREIVLGAEMFEADNQKPIDRYLSNEIDQKSLDTLARLWPNYKTDYAPLLNYAKKKNINFIATNIPRRYASMVYNGGFEVLDSLSSMEKEWMAPLPIAFEPDLPTYQNILEMMGDHGSPKLVMAQAIKDATMAHFILKNMEKDKLFLHYNGAYHSDFYEGIVWYIHQAKTKYKIGTISTVIQNDITTLEEENLGKADFIICVTKNMTTTY